MKDKRLLIFAECMVGHRNSNKFITFFLARPSKQLGSKIEFKGFSCKEKFTDIMKP